MTRPSQRWHALFQLFSALHEDYLDDFPCEEEALAHELSDSQTADLEQALLEWHEAFDNADDRTFAQTAKGFNSSYDPTIRFGSYRGWAEWVREHLERELGRRATQN